VREHGCPPVAVIGSESVSAIGVTMSVSVCERQMVRVTVSARGSN
jgi:hypothetical protein